jgi:hypothetical protein
MDSPKLSHFISNVNYGLMHYKFELVHSIKTLIYFLNNSVQFNQVQLEWISEATHTLLAALKTKVETSYHDNDLIMTPIISPQSGWQWTWNCPELHMGGFRDGGWQFLTFGRCD